MNEFELILDNKNTFNLERFYNEARKIWPAYKNALFM